MTERVDRWRRRWAAGVLFVACVCGSQPMAFVRGQETERQLWDTEFLKKRQPAPTPPGVPRTPPVYKRTTPASTTDNQAAGEMIGVTIWRLRPPTSGDGRDARLLIQEDDRGGSVEWIPERVEANTTFAPDERIRLSIESPRTGYLYVIDREMYADGSTSDPYLIFPTLRIRSGSYDVAPGRVIELPDRTAFRLRPMRPDYNGEQLTLVITSEPIPGVNAGPTIQKLDRSLIDDWERRWSARIERLEMVGGMGRAYTKADRDAAAGTRLLTQEDELPQTLLRVHARPGTPMLVNLSLPVGR